MKSLLLALLVATLGLSELASSETPAIKFVAVDIYLQSDEPVAAWQFELIDRGGQSKITGIENGESAAYDRAPYYDREAINLGQSDRVVVADYSLAAKEALPSGRFRLATVHLLQHGDDAAEFELTLVNASNHAGTAVNALISWTIRTGSQQ